jgi:chloramphenicol-sensitive protein RarD
MNNQKHYAAGISAFLIWGFIAIPLRSLSNYPIGAILYFRIFFALLVLLLIIFAIKRNELKKDLIFLKSFPIPQRNKIIMLTVAGGALLIVNWLTFIYIVNNVNIKTATFSYMICPVITAVLGFLLLKEKMTMLQWVAVGLCTVSCILIGIHSAMELGYSFLTALAYALYLVSQRRNQGFDRIVIMGIQLSIAFLILNLFYSYLTQEIPTSLHFHSTMLFIGAVFTVLPMFLSLYALNKINSATIGILLYLNPIVNFAVAILVFHEKVEVIQLVGYAIIVIALIMFNYPLVRRIQGAMSQKFS